MSLEFILGLIAVLFIVMYVYSAYSRENYRMYFGMGVTPLENECPAPFCGGSPPGTDEDENYPFLVNSGSIPGSTQYEQDTQRLNKVLVDGRRDTSESAKAAGYDLLDNNLIYPDDDIKETMNKIMQDGGLKDLTMDASTGMQKAESFELQDTIQNNFQRIGNYSNNLESFDPRNGLGSIQNNFQKIGNYSNSSGLGGMPYGAESFSTQDTIQNNFQKIGKYSNGLETFNANDNLGAIQNNFQRTSKYSNSIGPGGMPYREPMKNPTRYHRDSSGPNVDHDDTEHFMQAPSAITYAPAGSFIYEHPDMDGFNDAIYSNPGRTIGIADPQQAVIHFNESAAYYGNTQETLPVSHESSRWMNQYNPQIGASDYFDISEQYSLPIDNPKQPVAVVDYASNGTGVLYKKRMNVNDAMDELNRKRNDLLIGSAERGERVSKESRNIMNTVFSPDMDRYEKSVWYSHYEV